MSWTFLSVFLEIELIVYMSGSWAELYWLEGLSHVEPLSLDGLHFGNESPSVWICDETCTLN